jgi:hypothetical protein
MELQGITGAEVVDVFNFPPYGCSRRLYFQKTGEKQIDPCSYNDEQRIKNKIAILGDFVSKVYQKKTKRSVRKANQDFVNPRYPFMIGDVDRLQTNLRQATGSFVPLEIRILDRVGFYNLRKNGLPGEYYNYQMHHHMIAKKNAEWSSLAVFCPDIMELLTFDFAFDETTALDIIKAERSFWNQVQEKKAPIKMPDDNTCWLCGYRHKCGIPFDPFPAKIEERELQEQIIQIEAYLK